MGTVGTQICESIYAMCYIAYFEKKEWHSFKKRVHSFIALFSEDFICFFYFYLECSHYTQRNYLSWIYCVDYIEITFAFKKEERKKRTQKEKCQKKNIRKKEGKKRAALIFALLKKEWHSSFAFAFGSGAQKSAAL